MIYKYITLPSNYLLLIHKYTDKRRFIIWILNTYIFFTDGNMAI